MMQDTTAAPSLKRGPDRLVFDRSGRVIAVEGSLPEPPWEVTPSASFPGKQTQCERRGVSLGLARVRV
jgi:hypothetical protein